MHSVYFLNILRAVLKNTSRFLPPTNAPDQYFHDLANSIYSRYFWYITYCQIMASYDNEYIYFPPDGTWKMTNTQFFTMLTNFHGLEKASQIFNLRMVLTINLKTFSEYQLALLVLKILCSLTIEFSGKTPDLDRRENVFKSLSNYGQALLTTLDQHLNQMVKMAKMVDEVKMFKELIELDYQRVEKCVYNIKSLNSVECVNLN